MPRERGNPLLRSLDRYLGIPLVALGGALKRSRPLPREIRRIGILNATAIGDTVLLSAVARDVAAAYSDAETILFSTSANLPFLRSVDGLRLAPIQISKPREAVAAIRQAKLDVVLDFDSWPRIEPVYCMLSGASFAAGFRAPGQHRHYWYDRTVEHSPDLHALENFRRLAKLVGVESRSLPRLEPPGLVAEEQLPPRPYVVLHPWPTGYRSELKEWPAERWRELATSFLGRGYAVALTGSPADAPRAGALAGGVDGVHDLSGRFDLGRLLDVLAASSGVVSVNTGVMHMAAAVGAPTVALNGPTAALRWGPVGERVASVSSTLPGCGYLVFGWEYDGRRTDCMQGIEVEAVLTAAHGLMGER